MARSPRVHAHGLPSVSAVVALVCAAASVTSGCAREQKAAPYRVLIRVESDPGRALPGATVSFLGRVLGKTDDGGSVSLAIVGGEGEHVQLTVACPEGFVTPGKPTDVVLHRLLDSDRKPEYDVYCPPTKRSMVVVVRADRGPHLPVMVLGREVARTDESGAAHALLQVPANSEVEVTLATNEAGNERLRPQSPAMKFVAADEDEIKLFGVQFQLEPEKRRASAPARPQLPVRLN